MTTSATTAASAGASDLLRLVEQRSGQNLFACYQCGKCTAGCPFGLQPQRVMRLLQLGQAQAAMAEPTVHDCASCYTCETACPKGVSPALVNRALRAMSGNGHGHALRSWALTHVGEMWRLGRGVRTAMDFTMRLPGAGVMAEATVGIHRRRALPPLAPTTFPEWFARRSPEGDGHRGRAVLFHDTFMDFNYPGIGIAITELLERAGYRVELSDTVCCGRAMISKAQLAPATERACVNVTRLYEQVQDGAPIIGTEPSCLLSLREEYRELVPESLAAKAAFVADRTVLADELFAGLDRAGELELRFAPPERARRVLFHAHCHHKNSGRPDDSLELLRRAGYDAELLATSCCGMAGSFGFEKEHYELSRQAGERALFPLLRAEPGAQIAVTGMSCRQQIEHFTGRPTRHVVELLREAMP